ncbi:MAG: hypothetical protein MK116_10170 [Phycisphaerales bacterium]|nr:hypothetical protein [Phycisphaerales bacterium]
MATRIHFRREALYGLAAVLLLLAAPGLGDEKPAEAKPPATATPDGTVPEWPMISLALQDQYATGNLARIGVLNDAWCMSEYAVGAVTDHRLSREERMALHDESMKLFIEMPRSKMESSLERYLEIHPQLSRKTTRTIIIDIESPVQPRDFWRYLGGPDHDQITPEFTNIVNAFARRYSVIRDAFPNATLTVFSMGSPDSMGRERDIEKSRVRAEILAAKMGMLENVNAISPEVYERFGPKDPGYKQMKRATRQAMSHSLQIVKACGRPVDIIVLMSLTVYNAPGHSSLALKPADLNGLADRLEYLASLGVKRVIFWNGRDNLENTQIPVVERLTQLREIQQERARAVETGGSPKDDAPPEPPPSSSPGPATDPPGP